MVFRMVCPVENSSSTSTSGPLPDSSAGSRQQQVAGGVAVLLLEAAAGRDTGHLAPGGVQIRHRPDAVRDAVAEAGRGLGVPETTARATASAPSSARTRSPSA